jgi:hypothetical protein
VVQNFRDPLGGNAAAHAIQIAAAAQEAVKHLPHVWLGTGDIQRIIAMTSFGNASIYERVRMAQNIAMETAKSYMEQQRNSNVGDARHANPAQLAHGLIAGGMFGMGRVFAWQGDGGSGGGGASSLNSRGGAQYSQLHGGAGWSDVRTGPGTGFSWLSPGNQHVPGFTREQVAGAANFLRGLGQDRETVNYNTRHMVHLQPYRDEIGELIRRRQDIERRRAAGEDVSEDDRQQDRSRNELRDRMTPEQRRHFEQMRGIDRPSRADAHHDAEGARTRSDDQLSSAQSVRGPQSTDAASVQSRVDQRDARGSDADNLADLMNAAGPGVTRPQQTAGAPATSSATPQQANNPTPPQQSAAQTTPTGGTTRDASNTATAGNSGAAHNRPTQTARASAGPTPT